MKTPPNDERIQRALEGLLSPDELTAFQADVVRDEELRAAYVDQVWLHASLKAHRETLADLLEAPAAESGKIVRRWPVALWAASIAACVTLVASIALFGKGTFFRRPVATLVQ